MADSSAPQPPPPAAAPASASAPAQAPPASQDSSSATVVPKQEPDTADNTLDASIEQDVDLNTNNTANMPNQNPAGDDAAAAAGNSIPAPTSVDALAAAAAPAKKETSLREFMGKMDEYAPIVRFLALSSWIPSYVTFSLHYHPQLLPPHTSIPCLSNTDIFRSPTPSQPTISLLPVFHLRVTAPTKHRLTSPVFSLSQPRNLSPTSLPTRTSTRAFAPPTAPLPVTPWAV